MQIKVEDDASNCCVKAVDAKFATMHFKYLKLISAHQVGNVNSICNDQIALSDTGRIKWWPNTQYTFFLLMLVVNAVDIFANDWGDLSKLVLKFQEL